MIVRLTGGNDDEGDEHGVNHAHDANKMARDDESKRGTQRYEREHQDDCVPAKEKGLKSWNHHPGFRPGASPSQVRCGSHGLEDSMWQRTAFLSKLIGLFCVLYSLSMFTHREASLSAVSALIAEPGALLVLGVIVLGLGIAMVLGHNVWSMGALPVVVTVVGWLTLFKGLFLTFLAPAGATAYLSAMHYQQLFYIYAGVTLALGAYLTYGGFNMKGNLNAQGGR